MKALTYVMKQVQQPGERLMEVTAGLSDEDKRDLRNYARAECKVLGVELEDADSDA